MQDVEEVSVDVEPNEVATPQGPVRFTLAATTTGFVAQLADRSLGGWSNSPEGALDRLLDLVARSPMVSRAG